MIKEEDSKIDWIKCPECGAKIGIIVSTGKITEKQISSQVEFEEKWKPSSIEEKITSAGVDLSLINIEDREEVIIISPKKFLGDLWGSVNNAIKNLGGIWIRNGRNSRWEIIKEDLS